MNCSSVSTFLCVSHSSTFLVHLLPCHGIVTVKFHHQVDIPRPSSPLHYWQLKFLTKITERRPLSHRWNIHIWVNDNDDDVMATANEGHSTHTCTIVSYLFSFSLFPTRSFVLVLFFHIDKGEWRHRLMSASSFSFLLSRSQGFIPFLLFLSLHSSLVTFDYVSVCVYLCLREIKRKKGSGQLCVSACDFASSRFVTPSRRDSDF